MFAKSLIPVLNVSNMEETFAWFKRLGWDKAWDWGTFKPTVKVNPRDFEVYAEFARKSHVRCGA
jgi:hypothetical protein